MNFIPSLQECYQGNNYEIYYSVVMFNNQWMYCVQNSRNRGKE